MGVIGSIYFLLIYLSKIFFALFCEKMKSGQVSLKYFFVSQICNSFLVQDSFAIVFEALQKFVFLCNNIWKNIYVHVTTQCLSAFIRKYLCCLSIYPNINTNKHNIRVHNEWVKHALAYSVTRYTFANTYISPNTLNQR